MLKKLHAKFVAWLWPEDKKESLTPFEEKHSELHKQFWEAIDQKPTKVITHGDEDMKKARKLLKREEKKFKGLSETYFYGNLKKKSSTKKKKST